MKVEEAVENGEIFINLILKDFFFFYNRYLVKKILYSFIIIFKTKFKC